MTSQTMTIERLGQFGAAWACGDLDALMGFVTDDCVYLASVGPEPGTTYRGRDQVRRGFAAMLAYDRGRERQEGTAVVAGDRGFAEWSFTETTTDGGRRMIRGCDPVRVPRRPDQQEGRVPQGARDGPEHQNQQ